MWGHASVVHMSVCHLLCDSNHPDDLIQPRDVTPRFKPFPYN